MSEQSNLQGSMIVLHGPPKVGKTQLASRFPSTHLWIATEYGHKYLDNPNQHRIVQLDSETGWATFKELLKKKWDKGIKTVPLDTTGNLYNMCLKYVCESKGWTHPEDAPHGKGWSAVRSEFQNGIARLAERTQEIGATLICIDHTKEEEIVTTTTKTIKVNCAMPGQARSVLLPVPDHIWYLGYADPDDKSVDPLDAFKSKGSRRALFTQGSISIEAGTRDPRVKKHVIVPLSKNKPFEQISKELYV